MTYDWLYPVRYPFCYPLSRPHREHLKAIPELMQTWEGLL